MEFIFIIVCAENDQEWSRKISLFHKTRKMNIYIDFLPQTMKYLEQLRQEIFFSCLESLSNNNLTLY